MDTGIYFITCNANGRVYVGSSVGIRSRLERHLYELRKGTHYNVKLQRAWWKYGDAQFTFQPVLHCAEEHLLWFEQLFLDWVFSTENAFNSARVAESPMRGQSHTAAAKKRIGEAVANRNSAAPMSETTKAKIAASKRGRAMSEITKAKIGAARRGKPCSSETKAAISAAMKGKPKSAEHVEKLREAKKRFWLMKNGHFAH